MPYQNSSIELNTQKANSLMQLKNEGLPIPPTLFLNHSDKFAYEAEIASYLSTVTSQLFYLRLCFSDVAYPHYYGELVSSGRIVYTIEELLQRAYGENRTNFDVIIQPLQKLSVSGAILARGDRLLIESIVGAPPLLFRNGHFNSRFILENKRLILEEYQIQEESLIWDFADSNWAKIDNSKCVDTSILNHISSRDYDTLSLYEYGIDCDDEFWIFEKKSIPTNVYTSLDTIETGSSHFIVSGGKYSDTLYVDLPMFSEIDNCDEKNKYIIKSGAYTAHFPLYLALSNIACQFVRG